MTAASDQVLRIEMAYAAARQRFEELGVDTERAMQRLRQIAISLQCWQGDDLRGFEGLGVDVGGGLAVTGSYPGRARDIDELRADMETALRLVPGRHRVNLHASYADTGGKRVERNQLAQCHFQSWIDWAREHELGLDFNPTYFAHPLAADGFTLSHRDEFVRRFWIEHGIACRRIGAAMGKALGSACVTNTWIPDGSKDTPVDRRGPRERLREALDVIFGEELDPQYNLDAVESKLFGIGSESFVVGSHEFYLGYASAHKKMLCLDTGHFHPTESIADKVSSVFMWVDKLLLHVSRGVHWDSDHVVTLSDDVRALMQEVVRGDYIDRTHLALDYFDASINRVAAWVIGMRSTLNALLQALLEPSPLLREYEADGDLTTRLAMLEEVKNLPMSAVWDYYCLTWDVPVGPAWIDETRRYELEVRPCKKSCVS